MTSFDLKLERAKEQIHDLEREIASFRQAQRYKFTVERDPQTKEWLHKLTWIEDIPPIVAVKVGEVIYSLRSALDHLIHAIIVNNSGLAGPHRRSGFPFCITRKEFERRVTNTEMKSIGHEAIEILEDCQPYNGKYEYLAALNDLCNTDKHRALLLVNVRVQSVLMDTESALRSFVPSTGKFLFQAAQGNVNVGDILLRKPAHLDPSKDVKFSFDVAFGERGFLHGFPVVKCLGYLHDYVEHVTNLLKPYLTQKHNAPPASE